MENEYFDLPRSTGEAREIGSTLYFTGKPCKHGHIAPRVTANRTCRTCAYQRANADYAKNPEPKKARAKARYEENREEIKRYTSAWAKKNRAWVNARTARRYNSDPNFKATYLLRRYIRKMCDIHRGERKLSTSIKCLPYTTEEFVEHIERQFSKGMSWENHGEWHVDHIIPIAQFVKSGVTDPAVVNALSNMRPVWAEDNLVKGDRSHLLI